MKSVDGAEMGLGILINPGGIQNVDMAHENKLVH
jgi:hypothetical protein